MITSLTFKNKAHPLFLNFIIYEKIYHSEGAFTTVRLLIISVLVVAMIGLMVPNAVGQSIEELEKDVNQKKMLIGEVILKCQDDTIILLKTCNNQLRTLFSELEESYVLLLAKEKNDNFALRNELTKTIENIHNNENEIRDNLLYFNSSCDQREEHTSEKCLNFIDNFAYSIRNEYESIGRVLEDSYLASAFESKNWITVETTVATEEVITEEIPEVIQEKTMRLVHGNCDDIIMKVKDEISGKAIEDSVVQFFSESGSLLSEVNPKTGNFVNEPDAEFIKIWKEGYTPIVMDNPCGGKMSLSGEDMYFQRGDVETPEHIAKRVEEIENEREIVREQIAQERAEQNKPLTENEYYALVEAIYAKGAEYNLQCSQRYGPPFYNMDQQFAYNDCMNRYQSWEIAQLYKADARCCVQEAGGGCLIATAAYGSELAPQVQFLRELRDNTVLQTTSGTEFMNGFNQFYYSFSPAVADYERENPVFKEMVRVSLTPLLTSLTLLNYVEIDSEEEMLGYGIGIILLNIGMYFVAPAIIINVIRNLKRK